MRTRSLLLAAVLICSVAVAASAIPQNVVFILDASNSMNRILAVKTRIDAARDALSELLSGMPVGEDIGLLVYGHRINYKNEVESCQDIEMLFPIAPLDDVVRAQMIAAIGRIEGQGKTPLADSLTEAANAISATGEGGVIVLLSDGEGNCGGAQDIVAAMIATLDPPITIHVLGLDVEAEASETLRGIAGATGGSYWNIQEASGLLEALYAVAVPEDVIPSQFACLGVTNVIYGTEGDDIIYGTPEGDLILGLGGDDFVIGLDGNDVLCGGPGNDLLEGGTGNDLLDGGDGDDLMFGGPDDDHLCGGSGNDSLEGDLGDDVLDGGTGIDTLLGGRGHDVLYCADVADTLLEGTIMTGTYDRCPVCETSCPPIVECPPAPVEPPCPLPTPPCPVPVAPEPACPTPSTVKTLNEGESIQLHGTVSDTDCNVIQSLWQASAGAFDDPTSLHPVYTAPMLDGCTDLDVEVTLTAVDSCGASASDSFVLHILNVNHPPIADAGEPICIDEGTPIVLAASASDPDGEGLMVQWSVDGSLGSFEDPYVLQAVFVAPMIEACEGVDIIATLSVTDPCGATACDTVLIHVRDVNAGPTVDLGPDFAVDEGTIIQLTPATSDPQGNALRYCWTATAGTLDNPYAACPVFNVPMTTHCDGETLVVTLTVTDPCGLSSSDSVTIHVNDVNAGPTVDLGPDLCIIECDSVLLSPRVTDPDGDALTYAWSATAGVFGNLFAAATLYTAPATENCADMDVIITLTVTDPCGLSATDSILVHVENINQPPTVKADP
jgi:hypothetical protein